jgi:hypothetical protein
VLQTLISCWGDETIIKQYNELKSYPSYLLSQFCLGVVQRGQQFLQLGLNLVSVILAFFKVFLVWGANPGSFCFSFIIKKFYCWAAMVPPCLSWDRLVTQPCLLFCSGGTPVLLAYPRWCHFGPACLPPEWCHFLFTYGITNLSLYKHWFYQFFVPFIGICIQGKLTEGKGIA